MTPWPVQAPTRDRQIDRIISEGIFNDWDTLGIRRKFMIYILFSCSVIYMQHGCETRTQCHHWPLVRGFMIYAYIRCKCIFFFSYMLQQQLYYKILIQRDWSTVRSLPKIQKENLEPMSNLFGYLCIVDMLLLIRDPFTNMINFNHSMDK